MNIIEVNYKKIKVSKTARYYMIGKPSEKISSVWFVLHGYGQLGQDFIKYFKPVLNEETIVVAPEALNKFYLKGFDGKVGATWMTKEEREEEMDDYVNYLDSVYNEVINEGHFRKAKITVLGFSQGSSTAARWITRGRIKSDRLILWGGGIPRDVDTEKIKFHFDITPLMIVAGEKDQFVTEEVVEKESKRLNDLKLNYKIYRFNGGHEIKADVLRRLL